MLSVDFALAATYQDSWDGVNARDTPPTNYCHSQTATLGGTVTESGDIVTRYGLNGLTKCTYFLTVSSGNGAPGFRLSKSDYFKYQLHYAEWSSTDMTAQNWLTTGPYVGTYAANTYPSPFSITYPTGATGTADLKFEFPQAAGGLSHTNWYPYLQEPGNIGNF